MGVTTPENHNILWIFLHFFHFLIFLIERVDHVGRDQSPPKRLAHWNFAIVPAKSPKCHICCWKKRKNFIYKETNGHVSSVLLKSLPGARVSIPSCAQLQSPNTMLPSGGWQWKAFSEPSALWGTMSNSWFHCKAPTFHEAYLILHQANDKTNIKQMICSCFNLQEWRL